MIRPPSEYSPEAEVAELRRLGRHHEAARREERALAEQERNAKHASQSYQIHKAADKSLARTKVPPSKLLLTLLTSPKPKKVRR